MSAEFPTLAEVLADHRLQSTEMQGRELFRCSCLQSVVSTETAEYDAHVQRVWREACTIRTLGHILTLPAGTVIHTDRDSAVEKFADGHWYLPGRRGAVSIQRLIDQLPALLIWYPSWAQS